MLGGCAFGVSYGLWSRAELVRYCTLAWPRRVGGHDADIVRGVAGDGDVLWGVMYVCGTGDFPGPWGVCWCRCAGRLVRGWRGRAVVVVMGYGSGGVQS